MKVPVAQGDLVELEVEAMADGPDGLCRIGGYVVLVPGVLPGERVRVRITSAARKFGRGEPVAVLRPAAGRTAPRCRHFLDCGGCQLQHAAYPLQLQLKQQRLQRTLRHALGDAAPPVAEAVGAPEPWGQRHKIALHLRDSEGELQPCLYRLRSVELVPILECPVTDEDGLELAFAAVDELSRLDAPAWDPHRGGVLRSVLVRQSAGTGQSHVVVVATEPPPGLDRAARAIHAAGATSVALNLNQGPQAQLLGRETRLLVGPERIDERIGGRIHLLSPTAFFQTSPHAAAALCELVLDGLQPQAGEFAFDLYCGGGLLALPLAQRCRRVVGIEQHLDAVRDAEASAAANGLRNVEFVHAGVEAWLRRRHGPPPQLVALDPPRQGCGEAVAAAVARLQPRRVAYVSCDVEALAADLRVFAAHGLRALQVTPVDMFAHTSHVEAVAVLEPRT